MLDIAFFFLCWVNCRLLNCIIKPHTDSSQSELNLLLLYMTERLKVWQWVAQGVYFETLILKEPVCVPNLPVRPLPYNPAPLITSHNILLRLSCNTMPSSYLSTGLTSCRHSLWEWCTIYLFTVTYLRGTVFFIEVLHLHGYI